MNTMLKLYGEVRGEKAVTCVKSHGVTSVAVRPRASVSGNGSLKLKPSHPLGAFIGPGVRCKGIVISEGQMRIDGRLEGEIHTKGTLLVGEDAVVKAEIRAGSVISKGHISGNIVAKHEVRLLSSASVTGRVSTPHLSIEKGAKLETNWSLWVNRSRFSGRQWIQKYPHGSISHPSWWTPKQY